MEKGSDDLQNELIDFENNSACKNMFITFSISKLESAYKIFT